ncbi:endocuticle structural glycoprotein SgAbd-2-like [Cylas formicarius]|uniref:endocuticle structural glycoprotein SgAbd-2-like n=1 Tax=Cylas formicarius TaxID=197179 RepID=UPI002958CA0A|nr:endocuticle structural glycoprotein SgAbd-2-like [Cylas formicarius]
MKQIIVGLSILALASGAAINDESQAEILSQDSEVNFDGSFRSSFQTSNGISIQEQGQLKNAGSKNGEAQEVQGTIQYSSPDGTPVQLQYIADENGFQPQGGHLPVPPPIPDAIQKSIEWNAAHPEEQQEQAQQQPPNRRY